MITDKELDERVERAVENFMAGYNLPAEAEETKQKKPLFRSC